MNQKHLFPIIAGIAIAVLLLIVISADSARAEDARLHMNFKEDLSLVPETNPREGGPYPAMVVEAQYTELGITRTNKQWVDIETWTSDDRDANMTITLEQLNFYYSIAQEGYDAEPEIRVTLFIDGNFMDSLTHPFTDHDDGEMREEIIDFSEIIYQVAYDETLEFQLEYSGYEDLVFGYDHRIRDSGVTSVTDFLYTWNMSAVDREVILEVGDIFRSDWENVGNFINLSVDGEPRDDQSFTVTEGVSHNESGFIINSSYITWELDEPLLGGEQVEIWIKYIDADPGADLGMRKTVTADQGNLKKPIAEITSIDPENSYEGDEVTFDASGSSDEDGNVVWYHWESNRDGELYDGEEDEFTRSDLSIGVHEITLKVKDNDDVWSDEITAEIEVLEVPENKVPTVVLDGPADESLFDITTVILSWVGEDDDDDDLNYDVYLDDDPDPQVMIAEDITDESREVNDLEDGMTYHWKVVVSDGEDESESEIWSFTIELPKEPENAAPTVELVSPGNTSLFDTDQVQLVWRGKDDDGDGLRYSLWIGFDPNELILVDWNLTATTYLQTGLQPGITYYWQVVVHDGTDTGSSDVWIFSISSSSNGGSDSDDDFEIAGMNGYMVTGLISVIVIIVLAVALMNRGDEWEDEEYYDDEEYDDW